MWISILVCSTCTLKRILISFVYVSLLFPGVFCSIIRFWYNMHTYFFHYIVTYYAIYLHNFINIIQYICTIYVQCTYLLAWISIHIGNRMLNANNFCMLVLCTYYLWMMAKQNDVICIYICKSTFGKAKLFFLDFFRICITFSPNSFVFPLFTVQFTQVSSILKSKYVWLTYKLYDDLQRFFWY